MITNPRFTTIYVRDQQRSLDFFTGPIGFTVRADQSMGPGDDAPRWIEVSPPEGPTFLVLYLAGPDEENRVGVFGSVWFDCDDLDATFADLSAKGVEFPVEPRAADWDPSARWAQFADPDGNTYGLYPKEKG